MRRMQTTARSLTRLVITAIAVASISCSSQHATYTPDGRRGFVVTCGGFLNNWSSCLVKAGRACGNRGYDTIQGSEEDRSLLIACKLPQ
jgi:hypothetical protein